MRTRTVRWSLSTAALVVAGLALTACGPGDAVAGGRPSGSSPVPSSSVRIGNSPVAQNSSTSAPAEAAGPAKKAGVSCTDHIDYAGDPRSNAEINSIGEQTGHCPPVLTAGGGSVKKVGTPKKAGVSCTDHIDYAGDPRSNAQINSIGEQTGHCPPVSS